MEKFNTEYEYFTHTSPGKDFLELSQEEPTMTSIVVFRSYWNDQTNYDSDTAKVQSRAKEPLKKRQDTISKNQTLSHFELCS